MSEYNALLYFNQQSISKEMIRFLVVTTESIIPRIESTPSLTIPSLTSFICDLIKFSNIQTPTLMATSVFLSKLRQIIPANVEGVATTRHRIFLGCLILASKTLNDSSPLNKHWKKYAGDLLTLIEINTIERELLEYFDWDVTITIDELLASLSSFFPPIQAMLLKESQKQDSQGTIIDANLYRSLHSRTTTKNTDVSSTSHSNYSLPSLVSDATISSTESLSSNVSKATTLESKIDTGENVSKQSYFFRQPDNETSFGMDTIQEQTTHPVYLDSNNKTSKKFNFTKSSWRNIFA